MWRAPQMMAMYLTSVGERRCGKSGDRHDVDMQPPQQLRLGLASQIHYHNFDESPPFQQIS